MPGDHAGLLGGDHVIHVTARGWSSGLVFRMQEGADTCLAQQQETDMNDLENEAGRLSDDELDTVSGGRIKWSDIHMDYKAQLDLRNTDPPPTRYA